MPLNKLRPAPETPTLNESPLVTWSIILSLMASASGAIYVVGRGNEKWPDGKNYEIAILTPPSMSAMPSAKPSSSASGVKSAPSASAKPANSFEPILVKECMRFNEAGSSIVAKKRLSPELREQLNALEDIFYLDACSWWSNNKKTAPAKADPLIWGNRLKLLEAKRDQIIKDKCSATWEINERGEVNFYYY